ncbi:hypothetical protein [Entomospira culicis]|uniref:DUF4292 domain-containing protein n=1 Tax=Entomospira culicis TaxID=2719989 RepID=A0A968GKG1_9SPIO|nr:hypothetical protein [Entomospira culicis]NIZ19605.1 hypothetical protein [Entomospira culicis]NIZ69490.1 hypothetical protein [Entomospira culicis]WDI36605.1 hypothetical protein PVA46_04580 [Entomospira culicis]WDI38233.1 hypothetical protein PVA47_04590 [Entomospira culicis]
MRVKLLFSSLFLLSVTTCSLSSQALTQEHFTKRMLHLFAQQEPPQEVYNGTLQFTLDNGFILYIRNSQLTLQVPAEPFIQAGLLTQNKIQLNRYVLFNEKTNALIIAQSHAQTRDMQYLTAKEILNNLYTASHDEFNHLQLNTDDTNQEIRLSDGILLLKIDANTLHVGITRKNLEDLGLDITHLEGVILEEEYIFFSH